MTPRRYPHSGRGSRGPAFQTSSDAERPGALQRLNAPRPVDVRTTAGGLPTAVRRGGQWLTVAELLDHYRIDDRWWTATPVSRSYYDLLLEDGRAVTVFRDELSENWSQQRYG